MKPSKQKKKQEFKVNSEGSPEMHALRIKLFGDYLKNATATATATAFVTTTQKEKEEKVICYHR